MSKKSKRNRDKREQKNGYPFPATKEIIGHTKPQWKGKKKTKGGEEKTIVLEVSNQDNRLHKW